MVLRFATRAGNMWGVIEGMDPITTPLLILVLGNLAQELIADACKDHLKDKLKSVFGWLEKLGEYDKVELAYHDAMEQASVARSTFDLESGSTVS